MSTAPGFAHRSCPICGGQVQAVESSCVSRDDYLMGLPVRAASSIPDRAKLALSTNRPFIVAWLALFITIAGIGIVSPLLPKFAQEMGATGIFVGLAFSGYTITQIPLMLVVGRLSDKYGKKPFLCLGLLTYVVAALGYMVAPTFRELLMFRILSGVGTALVIPIAYAYVGEMAPPGREGRYMGILNVATIAGFGIGPMLGGFLDDTSGMDAAFLGMCILSAVGFLTVLLFLPVVATSKQPVAREAWASSFRSMLKDDAMRAFMAFHLMLGISYGSVLAFLPVFMTGVRQTTSVQVGTVIAARSIVNGTFSYPSGTLADRMNRVVLVVMGAALLFAAVALVPTVGGFAALLPLLMVVGFGEALAVPSATAIGVGRGREFGMGSVMGLANMSNAVAMLLSSMVGGAIETSVGMQWVFRSAGLAGLVCAATFLFFMLRARGREMVPDEAMNRFSK